MYGRVPESGISYLVEAKLVTGGTAGLKGRAYGFIRVDPRSATRVQLGRRISDILRWKHKVTSGVENLREAHIARLYLR